MNINTNHVYAAFNEQVDRSRGWLSAKMRDACGYKADVLLDRLTQRIVEIGLPPYAMAAHERLKTSTEFLPPPETRIDCGEAVIDVGSGRIAIPAARRRANEREFLIHWTYCLANICLGVFSLKKVRPATLIVDLTEEDLFRGGKDDRFVEYCRSGPITPLRDGQRFLVNSATTKISSDPAVHRYSRHPLMTLLREVRLGCLGRVRLLTRHLLLFFRYHRVILRVPQLSLISKEFAYSSVSFALDERSLIESIILTCSSWGCQPLWVRSLRQTPVHMIWYSQAWTTASYLSDGLKSVVPALRWIKADRHWVWTKAFAKYLASLGYGDTKIEVVGPIVWYLPELVPTDNSSIRIQAFDVPAVTDKVMLEVVGEITNYFHLNNLRAFVSDVVAMKQPLEEALKLPVSISLKMKRGMRRDYAVEYFEYMDALFAEGRLKKASFEENLYGLISGSDLVVAYPFTSPAYIAEWLGVPCIYYDPTQTILRDDFFDSESTVRFARGPAELLSAALELLGGKTSSALQPEPAQSGR